MPSLQSVCVVGLGYIGLPTAAVFADTGLDVYGVDVNEEAVNSINSGTPHIVEPQLDSLLKKVVTAGRLTASLEPKEADAFIIAVPTPFKGDYQPDLSYIEAASRAIAPYLRKGNLVILESTSPVGATEKMADWLSEARPDLTFPQQKGGQADISIAHCPERVLPGKILQEVVENDRVIGGMTRRCTSEAVALYQKVVKGKCHTTNARTAEMAKLTENSFRDVNIAFANELSLICDDLDINVWDLIKMANLHPRVNILTPGPGVGGHCIAVDPWFIVASNPETAKIIRQAREINDNKPKWVLEKIRQAAAKIDDPKIVCLGLAFKPNIDDLRESPSVKIVEELVEMDIGRISVVEPHIATLPARLADKDVLFEDFSAAIPEADIVVLLVNHDLFGDVKLNDLKDKTVIDTCGGWSSPGWLRTTRND